MMTSNNFYLNNDPLLFQSTYSSAIQSSEEEMRKKVNDSMMQYKILQEQQMQNNNALDYLGKLDDEVKHLSDDAISILNEDKEYQKLSTELQGLIQSELMSNIRWKINNNPSAIKNMERQKEIISNVNEELMKEQKRNINELNEYMKHYSNMTFDEYKKMKDEEKE